MKKVVFTFPDSTSMANFIIREKIRGAQVRSYDKILVAPMSDKQIVSAETLYGAFLKEMIPKN